MYATGYPGGPNTNVLFLLCVKQNSIHVKGREDVFTGFEMFCHLINMSRPIMSNVFAINTATPGLATGGDSHTSVPVAELQPISEPSSRWSPEEPGIQA